MSITKRLRKDNALYSLVLDARNIVLRFQYYLRGQKNIIRRNYKSIFGTDINFDNPQTLNEKIQWLKVYDNKKIYSVWADKYGCRDYIRKEFGEDYLVPLLFKTRKVSDINSKNINVFPCVIKANHSSGDWMILKKAEDVDWNELRIKCREWLKNDFHIRSEEKQYKTIKRYIIVEKLLVNKNGKIPNDYKLHFINGKLAFIYCSIDREGSNKRQIYDINWNVLPFSYDGKKNPIISTPLIEKPKTFDDMLRIGTHFANVLSYVRVDFYDVDGKLYCGEITLHHGNGYDRFNPPEYDLIYGKQLVLPKK